MIEKEIADSLLPQVIDLPLFNFQWNDFYLVSLVNTEKLTKKIKFNAFMCLFGKI